MSSQHERALSEASTLTILSDEFTRDVVSVTRPILTTDELVQKARAYLRCLPDAQEIPGMGGIKALPILEATLKYAPCDHGRRYACSVIISGGSDNQTHLIDVANDWVRFFLLPFVCTYNNSSPPHSKHSTPTTVDTQLNMTTVKKNWPGSFRELLEKRQEKQCAIINAHPETIIVDAAHIIKRSLAKENCSETGITFSPSVPAMWDIIQHHADISVEDLESKLDSPENGFLLELQMHRAFDSFKWCLIPTDQPDEYTVKWFSKELLFFTLSGHTDVKFQNCSDRSIPLPKREYLALHASIAQILNETALGESFNSVRDFFMPDPSMIPAGKLRGEDFPLRIAVMEMFRPPLLYT